MMSRMTDPQKDEATKAGDELLRRLLKTPPDPKKPKEQPLGQRKPEAVRRAKNRGATKK